MRSQRIIGMAALCAMCVLFGGAAAVLAKDVTMKFTTPTNQTNTTVTVYMQPDYITATATIEPGWTVTQKRDAIKAAIVAANPGMTIDDSGVDGLVVRAIHDSTNVTFDMGTTGEDKDKILSKDVQQGAIKFEGRFEPFDHENLPAVFTAGITTDAGELTVGVNSEELQFQTDGPIICQALFERLAPQAPNYGVDVLLAGERLEVYFVPLYSVNIGGITFGTTSPSEGCAGSLNVGQSRQPTLRVTGECPGTVRLEWNDAPPDQVMGIVYAAEQGETRIPNNQPCAGTPLGLGTNQLQLIRTLNSGPNGQGEVSGSAGRSACGNFLQLVIASGNPCTTSNVATIPGR